MSDEIIGYWHPRSRAFIPPEVFDNMKADMPDSVVVTEWLPIPKPARVVTVLTNNLDNNDVPDGPPQHIIDRANEGNLWRLAMLRVCLNKFSTMPDPREWESWSPQQAVDWAMDPKVRTAVDATEAAREVVRAWDALADDVLTADIANEEPTACALMQAVAALLFVVLRPDA